MSDDPPINFDDLVKAPKKATSEGYPYQLSSKDLMRNFVFATLQVDPDYIEAAQGLGGYPARKLKIFPPIPASGTYVLGAIAGVLTWISTEEC
jgi:hypothetical protein